MYLHFLFFNNLGLSQNKSTQKKHSLPKKVAFLLAKKCHSQVELFPTMCGSIPGLKSQSQYIFSLLIKKNVILYENKLLIWPKNL